MKTTAECFYFVPFADETDALSQNCLKWAGSADALLFDFENISSREEKADARKALMRSWRRFRELKKLNVICISSEIEEQRRDLEAIVGLEDKMVLISKIESVACVERVVRMAPTEGLAVRLETPLSILNADEIIALPVVKTAFLESEKLSLRMGAEQTSESLDFAAGKIINAAAAFGKRAIGCSGAFRSLADDETLKFKETIRHSKELGFTGCFAIRPSQIELIRQVFSENELSIDELERRTQHRSDQAVLLFGNEMIGPPMRDRYRNMLKNRKK